MKHLNNPKIFLLIAAAGKQAVGKLKIKPILPPQPLPQPQPSTSRGRPRRVIYKEDPIDDVEDEVMVKTTRRGRIIPIKTPQDAEDKDYKPKKGFNQLGITPKAKSSPTAAAKNTKIQVIKPNVKQQPIKLPVKPPVKQPANKNVNKPTNKNKKVVPPPPPPKPPAKSRNIGGKSLAGRPVRGPYKKSKAQLQKEISSGTFSKNVANKNYTKVTYNPITFQYQQQPPPTFGHFPFESNVLVAVNPEMLDPLAMPDDNFGDGSIKTEIMEDEAPLMFDNINTDLGPLTDMIETHEHPIEITDEPITDEPVEDPMGKYKDLIL